MGTRQRLSVVTACLIYFAFLVSANFHEDDFVPTSRRAQFHGVSTTSLQWDMSMNALLPFWTITGFDAGANTLARCAWAALPEIRRGSPGEDNNRGDRPSFERQAMQQGGVTRNSNSAQVALPVPEPKGFAVADNYKLQLTFDGAVLSSWRHARLQMRSWEAASTGVMFFQHRGPPGNALAQDPGQGRAGGAHAQD